MDVVHSWNMLDVNSRILDDVYESIDGRIEGTIGDRADKIVVSDGSVVRAGSHITGPVVIGRDCEIGPNVVIAPSTSIGDNVTIEPFTYIRNSVILDDVYIGSHSTIRNSIIGENNRIDSHFITASGRNLLIELGGILHHADELGSVIGDGNVIGCDVSTDPGTLIGTECRIGTGAVIRGKIPNRAVVAESLRISAHWRLCLYSLTFSSGLSTAGTTPLELRSLVTASGHQRQRGAWMILCRSPPRFMGI